MSERNDHIYAPKHAVLASMHTYAYACTREFRQVQRQIGHQLDARFRFATAVDLSPLESMDRLSETERQVCCNGLLNLCAIFVNTYECVCVCLCVCVSFFVYV